MSQEIRSLLCPLSDEDFKVRAHNLAAARQRSREIEAEKKAANAKFALQLKEINEEIDQLAAVVKSKYEARPVSVEWVKDMKHGVKRLVRLDTDDVIDTKALTLDEKQATLAFGSSAKKAEDAAKNGANGNGEKKAKKNGKAAKAPTTETPASA